VSDPAGREPFRILVVCTANICRSVMAQAFLEREVAARGLDVTVGSCGIRFDGEPASETVIGVRAERSLDVAGHRSRRFTPELLADADLVVTMERMQAREVTVAVGGLSSRVHTLGALVEWLGTNDVEGSPAERVARFASGRHAGDLLGSGRDEIEDPHGRSKRVHRKAADRIEALCGALLDGLFGPAPEV